MKKLYTIIMAFSLATISYAQPVLNASDFSSTTAYTYYLYSAQNDIQGLSPGSAGANVTWDFSGMTGTVKGTYSVLPVASTPYAADFPLANYAYKVIFDGAPDYYAYYNVSSTAFELLGSKDTGYADLLLDTSTIFTFPYTYQTSFSDSYRNEEDPIGGFTNTITYDAYGTLKTPYDTYTNVIRRKSVEVDGNGTFTDYEWYTVNPAKLVMAMGFNDNNVDNYHSNYTNFLSSTNLSVKTNDITKLISVYPNPATSIININYSNNVTIDKVVVFDLTGRVILQLEENTSKINVEKLAAGLYIIEVYSGNEKYTSKFVKK